MDTIKETMQDLMDIIKRSKNSDMEEGVPLFRNAFESG